jgi:superfamily I DNA/RNA helicase
LSAIDFVSTDLSVGKKIYFEGGLSSYTYAEEGASLHDVLNLYNKKHRLIKDPLLKNMRDIDELGRYIEKSGDLDLAMMLKIVRKYGNQVYKLIEMLKASHVADGEKHLAEMFFSTVHRCKGLEYDSVSLVGDFVDQVKIEKAKQASGVSDYDLEKLNEEINLLYVAVTRAKYFLEIPIRLVPKDFARDMSNIIVIGEKVEDG